MYKFTSFSLYFSFFLSDYWGGKKGVLPPHPNYWGGACPGCPPPESTPMRIIHAIVIYLLHKLSAQHYTKYYFSKRLHSVLKISLPRNITSLKHGTHDTSKNISISTAGLVAITAGNCNCY